MRKGNLLLVMLMQESTRLQGVLGDRYAVLPLAMTWLSEDGRFGRHQVIVWRGRRGRAPALQKTLKSS